MMTMVPQWYFWVILAGSVLTIIILVVTFLRYQKKKRIVESQRSRCAISSKRHLFTLRRTPYSGLADQPGTSGEPYVPDQQGASVPSGSHQHLDGTKADPDHSRQRSGPAVQQNSETPGSGTNTDPQWPVSFELRNFVASGAQDVENGGPGGGLGADTSSDNDASKKTPKSNRTAKNVYLEAKDGGMLGDIEQGIQPPGSAPPTGGQFDNQSRDFEALRPTTAPPLNNKPTTAKHPPQPGPRKNSSANSSTTGNWTVDKMPNIAT